MSIHVPAPEKIASPWLTAREAALRVRTSPKRLYSAVRARKLRAVRLGNGLLFRSEWVDSFLESNGAMIEVQ